MRPAALLVLAAALAAAPAAAEEPAKGEEVRFVTSDGVSIAGTYYAPAEGTPLPAPAVVALPMYRRTRDSFAPMVRPVTDRGMALLAIDLRGHGRSAKQGGADLAQRVESRDAALFNAMHLDVAGAVAWLAREKQTPKGKVALLGASVGCSVAIDAAVRAPDDVGAVACLTPGRDYLGVPTLEHVAKWRSGAPLLLVSSGAEASGGASQIAARLDGKGAELRIVEPDDAAAAGDAADLHGTNMFGRVAGVEENVADWLAYHVAFRRIDLGDGLTGIVGSTGTSLYVAVAEPESREAPAKLSVRIGTGPVTDPWSKSETIDAARRLVSGGEGGALGRSRRHRTRIGRERIGTAPGQSFAVALSADGVRFVPAAGEPQIRITLR